MSRGKSKTEKPDVPGGGFIMLPDCLRSSAAYRTASFRAKAALVILLGRHNGFKNGKITERGRTGGPLDCQNLRANAAAMAEPQSPGMVERAKDYPRGVRLAREYRLKFPGMVEITERKKKRVVAIAATGQDRPSLCRKGRKLQRKLAREASTRL